MACEKCSRDQVEGERFCRNHRNALLREMKSSGYLTPVPRTRWSSQNYEAQVGPETEVRILAKF